MRWSRQWWVCNHYRFKQQKSVYIRVLWFAFTIRYGKGAGKHPNGRVFFYGMLPMCMWGKRYK